MRSDMMNIGDQIRTRSIPASGKLPLILVIAIATGTLAVQRSVAQTSAAPPSPPPLIGVWYDDTGQGAIELSPCGDRLCGRVVWLKKPVDEGGQPITDG